MLKAAGWGSPSWARHVWPHLTRAACCPAAGREGMDPPPSERARAGGSDFTVAVYAGGGLSSAHSAMKQAETGPCTRPSRPIPTAWSSAGSIPAFPAPTTSLCWPMTDKKLEENWHARRFRTHHRRRSPALLARTTTPYFTDRYSLFHSHGVRSRGYSGERPLGAPGGPPPPWSEKEGDQAMKYLTSLFLGSPCLALGTPSNAVGEVTAEGWAEHRAVPSGSTTRVIPSKPGPMRTAGPHPGLRAKRHLELLELRGRLRE